ncbi:YycH family regulatory protein [Ignavigranum ruoffiae]
MRRNRILSFVLTFCVLLSVLLTYYLLYDMTSLKQLLQPGKTEGNQEVVMQGERDIPNFYQTSALEFKDTYKPFKYIYRSEEATEWIIDPTLIESLASTLAENQINLSRDDFQEDQKFIENLYALNHLQVQFADEIPLSFLTDYVQIHQEDQAESYINQIIYPLDGERTVCLLNTRTNQYYLGHLNKAVDRKSLHQEVSQSKVQAIEVQGYIGKAGMIYLPNDPVHLDDQVYTLESIPEHLFLSAFSENAALKNTETSNTKVTYFNYQYTLDFTEDKQMLSVRVNRPGDTNQRSFAEKIENTFKYIKRYDYWPGDLRLMGAKHNLAQYRRYLNNLPIFSLGRTNDYGSSKMYIRNNNSGDIYRYQFPLLIFHAHIPDQSQSIQLASAAEIFEKVKDHGYSLSQFDDVFIGYQWQDDMEAGKKAHLIPKWYIKIDDNFYSLDQMDSAAFEAEFQDDTEILPGGE